MKKGTLALGILSMVMLLTSCQAIGDIFKAGVWAGVLFVVVIIAIVIFVISKLFGGNKS